ncbi:ABC transporter permease [Alphaproteobacteria bacterium]|nr:ABC transporter permease [Alphaproteobacteria bacterium]
MIKLVPRGSSSQSMFILAPIFAIFLTLLTGSIIFFLMGYNPSNALKIFFISPISNAYGLSELLVKATPLALIAMGLSFCFKNNIYNIGAEGQLTMGAIFGGGVGIYFYDVSSILILPGMIIAGALGGALWAMIPAFLKTKFNTNEILTSLMLAYIALLILDYLVVGPWRDPDGFNFPKTRSFGESGRMPILFQGLRIHFGLIITLILIAFSWFIYSKTIFGFQLKVSGFSPKAARFAGFNKNFLIFSAFAISGAFAGLAGVGEVSGPIGLIYRDISPNYGFTAIIVCFLGRLHPLGIIFASLVIALTYLGAEDAQLFLQIPAAVGFVFQGLVLFFLLGSDLLVNFKLRLKN